MVRRALSKVSRVRLEQCIGVVKESISVSKAGRGNVEKLRMEKKDHPIRTQGEELDHGS